MEARGGAAEEQLQPDIAYQLWSILHRSGDEMDPMVKFALDLKSELESNPQAPLRDHLTQKLDALKKEERDILNQIEVKNNAREKLAMEMKKFDLALKQLDEKKRAIRQHQKYTDSCLKDLISKESMLKLDIIQTTGTAQANMGGLGAYEQKREPAPPQQPAAQQMPVTQPFATNIPAQQQQHNVPHMDTIPARGSSGSSNSSNDSYGSSQQSDARRIDAVLWHLQAFILRCLIEIVKRWNNTIITGKSKPEKEPSIVDVFLQNKALEVLVKLLHSVNIEVKADTAMLATTLTTDIPLKDAFGASGGIHALVSILKQSNNEFVLEKALTCVWHLAMSDTNKTVIREAGGLVAIVDLLHTENDVILENATIALGYLTRDDSNKIAIRKCNGLEKLIATLYYPSESIQSKAAGALWNCASNTENKVVIRQLGSIAALIDLLGSRNESVQENAAGGLWNCAVDQDNKRLVRELGGLQPLIHLLNSPVESVVENASGTLWNCAAVGENRVAIRKLGGLDPLLKLLLARNENIQENAAGAIRNCAINDQNKVALKDLGGLHLFIDLLDKTKYSVLEKLTSTLWICSINNDNKHVIRECNGFPKLLKALNHENFSIKEKALGILRNCSTLAENREALIHCNAIAKLVEILNGPPEKLTSGMREYAAATLWNVARDDKVTARNEGAIRALCNLLADKTPSVVENAAGSLLSLTINAENKDHVREIGGIQALVQCLSSKNDFILENVTGALKNCTSNNPRNQELVRTLDAIPKIVGLLKSENENVIREAALCLKNLAADRANNEMIVQYGGVAKLQELAERSASESIKKVASFSLSALSKHEAYPKMT
eukprot:TRINITY_DN8251_c0_g1_i1.p1 TRINITY_DN8251_c0_g1~~TRINITY_DN8251_c0_g1_i1.p1  ORF type:complete len:840 (+),score=322.62 TRINITY_DN8251_c0_g1_i1:25-2544(+)